MERYPAFHALRRVHRAVGRAGEQALLIDVEADALAEDDIERLDVPADEALQVV